MTVGAWIFMILVWGTIFTTMALSFHKLLNK